MTLFARTVSTKDTRLLTIRLQRIILGTYKGHSTSQMIRIGPHDQ